MPFIKRLDEAYSKLWRAFGKTQSWPLKLVIGFATTIILLALIIFEIVTLHGFFAFFDRSMKYFRSPDGLESDISMISNLFRFTSTDKVLAIITIVVITAIFVSVLAVLPNRRYLKYAVLTFPLTIVVACAILWQSPPSAAQRVNQNIAIIRTSVPIEKVDQRSSALEIEITQAVVDINLARSKNHLRPLLIEELAITDIINAKDQIIDYLNINDVSFAIFLIPDHLINYKAVLDHIKGDTFSFLIVPVDFPHSPQDYNAIGVYEDPTRFAEALGNALTTAESQRRVSEILVVNDGDSIPNRYASEFISAFEFSMKNATDFTPAISRNPISSGKCDTISQNVSDFVHYSLLLIVDTGPCQVLLAESIRNSEPNLPIAASPRILDYATLEWLQANSMIVPIPAPLERLLEKSRSRTKTGSSNYQASNSFGKIHSSPILFSSALTSLLIIDGLLGHSAASMKSKTIPALAKLVGEIRVPDIESPYFSPFGIISVSESPGAPHIIGGDVSVLRSEAIIFPVPRPTVVP